MKLASDSQCLRAGGFIAAEPKDANAAVCCRTSAHDLSPDLLPALGRELWLRSCCLVPNLGAMGSFWSEQLCASRFLSLPSPQWAQARGENPWVSLLWLHLPSESWRVWSLPGSKGFKQRWRRVSPCPARGDSSPHARASPGAQVLLQGSLQRDIIESESPDILSWKQS